MTHRHQTRNITTLLTATIALAGTSAVSADFIGVTGDFQMYDDGSQVWCVLDLYAEFSDPQNALLNVFNADITLGSGREFNHNDLADAQGGSWKPSFSFEIPGAYDPMRDSYVTIGYGVGSEAAFNQTALDPGFGSGTGGLIPSGAGWFNLTPDNPQYADSSGRVHIGHFATAYDPLSFEDFWFEAEFGYNSGPGTDVAFGQGSFGWIPAPGPIAFITIAGIASRRRRD